MNDPAPRGRSPAELNGKAETLSTLTDCQCDVEGTRNPRCLMDRLTCVFCGTALKKKMQCSPSYNNKRDGYTIQ